MEVINIENISVLERKTIVTVGMFDGLHVGHRHLLACLMEQSRARNLEPVVVTFDSHPRSVLFPETPMALLSTCGERMRLLEDIGVPTVVLVRFTRETASLSACRFAERFLCRKLGMRTLLLGYDNSFGSKSDNDFAQLPQLAERYGFDIVRDSAVILDGVEVSSTKIRRALQEGNLRRANAMLGAPYSVAGHVVHGRHIGTGIGFPTANIEPDELCKMLPAAGVYALRATVDGAVWPAMANLGEQPTFDGKKTVLEVNMIGFEGDIYGKKIKVDFVERIRDIQTFASADELAARLVRDREKVLEMLGD